MTAPKKQKTLKILAVEDSKIYTRVIKKYLADWEYDFTILPDGGEAWRFLQNEKPEMILLDWNLPGMNGIDICRKIRQSKSENYIYIIMLTSMKSQSDVMAGFEAGADDYITKPFDRELLHARINVGWRIVKLQQNNAAKAGELARSNDEQKGLITKLREQNRVITQKTNQLHDTQKQLLDTARKAGMAEIATSVLHNVGNVLNTAFTSSAVIKEIAHESKITILNKLAGVVKDHQDDFNRYVAEDPKGKQFTEFFIQLTNTLVEENREVKGKLAILTESHNHIQQIISLQQTYAGISGVKEEVSLPTLIGDATQLCEESFRKHNITTSFHSEPDFPTTFIEKHKVLQIILNLLQNARDALIDMESEGREISIQLCPAGTGSLRICITDNGIGIKEPDLNRIFSYGFTTKPDGHGFGLHGCANLAREMGGSLIVKSEGPGKGATFNLILPIENTEVYGG